MPGKEVGLMRMRSARKFVIYSPTLSPTQAATDDGCVSLQWRSPVAMGGFSEARGCVEELRTGI